MKQLTRRIIIPVIILSFVIIVIPICINEAYKCNAGYTTLWGASELLAYYGTILGAISSIAIAVMTIRFTRKQIKSENFLNQEMRKLTQIENNYVHVLRNINPITISEIIIKTNFHDGITKILQTISELQKYIGDLKIMFDDLSLSIGRNEYKELEHLVLQLKQVIDECSIIATDAINLYTKCYKKCLTSEWKIELIIENEAGHSFTNNEIEFAKSLIRDTSEFDNSVYQNELKLIYDKIISAHDSLYTDLMLNYTEVFGVIFANVKVKSEDIIS